MRNIEKLEAGQTFKNYKELCAFLEMEIKKSTDTKNAQFKELSRYCKYNKVGHKFTIEKIYEYPLEKIENRGKSEGSRNTIYGDMIQLLILDLLAQCKNGHVSISRGKLLLLISMINNNYRTCAEQVKQLSLYTEIDEAIIYDFYNTSNSNFKSAIETALKRLMDKRIIWYDFVTKVAEIESRDHRLATQEEKELIMKIEKDCLEEFEYKEISQVRCSKHWKKFKSTVKKHLHLESDLDYYYLAYEITVNVEYLYRERKELADLLLSGMERHEYRDKLNETVFSQLLINAQKRHENGFTSRKMGRFRMQETYLDSIAKLAKLLIDKTSRSIIYEVTNFKPVQKEWDESLDYLFS